MAKERFYNVVKTALTKEGWKITADRFKVPAAVRAPVCETFFRRRFVAAAVKRDQLT
jgi:hypothetical protein